MELQIKYPSVSSSSLHELISDVVENRGCQASNALMLKNMLTIVQWETHTGSSVVRYFQCCQ